MTIFAKMLSAESWERKSSPFRPVGNPLAAGRVPGTPRLQRKPACACGGGCPRCEAAGSGLKIGEPDDAYEREADRVAEQVMRMPEPALQRQEDMEGNDGEVAEENAAEAEPAAGGGEPEAIDEEETIVQRRTIPGIPTAPRREGSEAPAAVREVLNGPGRPLDQATRAFLEPRFGHDFGRVRIHADAQAAESARAVNALAYTVGRDIVFGAGQYAPDTLAGKGLLAHELTHVLQQGGMESSGASKRSKRSPAVLQRACTAPSHCPSDFCRPFPNRRAALANRDGPPPANLFEAVGIPAIPEITQIAGLLGLSFADTLLQGISLRVDPRVVPLWRQFIFGGSRPRNLTGTFGADFTSSATTARTTDFLVDALRASLASRPPRLRRRATINLERRIASAMREIDDPGSANRMNFNAIGEVPGNIAGDIGKDQRSCPAGARPSPFNDSRTASGTATLTRNPDGTVTVVPRIRYTVRDTIDLCPGDCGANQEWIATVPLSRWEATGISGDVPYTVRFDAPPRSFTV